MQEANVEGSWSSFLASLSQSVELLRYSQLDLELFCRLSGFILTILARYDEPQFS